MREQTFTYRVTVTATKTDGSGKFDMNDLENEVQQLFDELAGEAVYVSNENDEEIAFDTSWKVELQG